MNGTNDLSAPFGAGRRGRNAVALHDGFRPAYDDDASAMSYAQHFDPAFGRRFAERALDALVVVRGARVLDVACGTGVFGRLCAHVVGPSGRVVGIDPSAIAVAAARRIDPTSTVDWRHWDEGGLPFDDGTFDVVACQHALHRFPDPVLILEEMRRVLAPGGRLGITLWGPIEENPAFHAGLVDVSCQTIRMLAALPRVAEWVRVYPSLPPLSRVWPQCDQNVRVRFLSRATELLRPFEHDSVLRVQASSRLLVGRRPRH